MTAFKLTGGIITESLVKLDISTQHMVTISTWSPLVHEYSLSIIIMCVYECRGDIIYTQSGQVEQGIEAILPIT